MSLVTNKVSASKGRKPKFFVKGKPSDFTLITDSGATVKAVLTEDSYYKITTSSNFRASDLREVAEHFAELADIMEGTLAA